MKQIRKNNFLPEIDSVKSKLAAYGAVAACVLASGTEAQAQCGTATAGAPLPVDIDGDGTDDVFINVNSFPGPYLLTSSSYAINTNIGTSTVPLSFLATVTATQPGPGTSWNGCFTTQTPGGGFTQIVPYATATAQVQVTGSIRYQNQVLNQNVLTYQLYGFNYAVASGANIVGLSAAGSDVCAAVTGGSGAFLGTNVNYINYVFTGYTVSAGSLYYNLIPGSTSAVYDAPPCTSTGGAYYAGYIAAAYLLPLQTTIPGPFLIASAPFTTVYAGSFSNSFPGASFIAAEFAGADGTHYGWVEVAFNPDGSVTCLNTGYNGCSVEEVAAAGAAAGTECIAVGDATTNTANEACTAAVCAITPVDNGDAACDDAGTDMDPADDTFTFSITVNQGDAANFPTFSDDQGNTGVAYGGSQAYGPFPIAGGAVTINFTDDTDPNCVNSITVQPPATCSDAVAVCSLTSAGLVAGACDNAGTTAEDNTADGDDTFELTVNATGMNTAATYTISGDVTGTGTYGTPSTFPGLAADGSTLTITITDDGDPNCTITETVTAPAACSMDSPTTDIPTLSEWGLITLMLLLMSYGSIALTATTRLAGVRNRNINLPGGKMFSLPFDNAIYRKALMITALLVAGGFVASIATIGTVLASDIIGSAIAGPVFAYLGHLLYLIETKRKK